MIRLLTKLIGEIPGITPLAIPDYLTVYSPWMFGMSIDPDQFRCTVDDFGRQLVAAGIPGAGTARYYFPAIGSAFLENSAKAQKYPYSMPPASREYPYGADTCPQAWKFLQTWLRWSSFCEKYTEDHCHLAKEIVSSVAEKNRKA
jgi:hypothetical protein